jgi:hypothetical protein
VVPWQWPASPALLSLSRCCASEIQQALLALLAGEAFLADRPWQEIWWGRMRLDLASGWQLEIAIERDQLGALLWARAADGRNWEFGCQRDDWTLGPDSRIVEPVTLLQPAQRQQLERLLRDAICWPAPLIRAEHAVFCCLVEPVTRRGKGRHWRQRGRAIGYWHQGVADSNRQQKP